MAEIHVDRKKKRGGLGWVLALILVVLVGIAVWWLFSGRTLTVDTLAPAPALDRIVHDATLTEGIEYGT